jgi:hypothetical protein
VFIWVVSLIDMIYSIIRRRHMPRATFATMAALLAGAEYEITVTMTMPGPSKKWGGYSTEN